MTELYSFGVPNFESHVYTVPSISIFSPENKSFYEVKPESNLNLNNLKEHQIEMTWKSMSDCLCHFVLLVA